MIKWNVGEIQLLKFHIDSKWTDGPIDGSMTVPLGYGEKLIHYHEGTDNGFMNWVLSLLKSKKTANYSEEAVFNKK